MPLSRAERAMLYAPRVHGPETVPTALNDEQLRHAVIVQVARVECAVRANVRGELEYGAMATVRRKAIDALVRMEERYEPAVESG